MNRLEIIRTSDWTTFENPDLFLQAHTDNSAFRYKFPK